MNRHRATTMAAICGAAAILTAACGSGEPTGFNEAVGEAAESGAAERGDMLEGLRKSGTIRVANTQVNPPFSFVDESNEVVGYDVDVAEEVARRLGIDDVEYVVGTFQTFIPGLQSNKWDAVVAGLTITEERRNQVEFSCSYLVNDIAVFAVPGGGSDEDFEDEEDLVGKRVAVTAGGVQEEQISRIDGVDVMTYDNATLALRDVATGRADLYVGSKFTGAYLADQNDLDVKPLEAKLGGLLATEVTAMAFPKGQDQLVRAVDEALEEMIADGTLSDLSREWFGGLDVVENLQEVECS